MYNKLNISYFDNNYEISGEHLDGLYCIFTGDTASNKTFDVNSAGTYFTIDNNFFTSSQTNDNILITIFDSSGSTVPTFGLTTPAFLNYYTTIESITGNLITIGGDIPLTIYNDLCVSGYSYRIRNLHYAEAGINSFTDYINASPYQDLIRAEAIGGNIDIVIDSDYKYFDYNFIDVSFSIVSGSTTETSAYTFETDNQYANYEFNTFIDNVFYPNQAPTNLYDENTLCLGEYFIEEIYDTTNDTQYISGGWYPIQSSRYKIIPDDNHKSRLKSFKPYTWIDFGLLNKVISTIDYNYYYRGDLMQSSVTFTANETPYVISDSGRTMITEVTNDYMIIEKCFNDTTVSGFTGVGTVSGITGIYDIINVAKTEDISDILLKVYVNRDDDYYEIKSDSERYRINGIYGQITASNELIRNNSTGVLYQDNKDYFNLNIFNVNVNSAYTFDDPNLLYQPVELIDLGIDKKTKAPIPIEIENLDISSEITNWFLSGTTFTGASYYDEYSNVWDTIIINDSIYSIIEWCDKILMSGTTYYTGDYSTLDIENNKSFMLLESKAGELNKIIPFYYEWFDSDRRIDNIKLRSDLDNNINLMITHFDNRDDKNLTFPTISATTEESNNGSDLIFFDLSANTIDIIQYSANTTISFTDIISDSNNYKYMLGRYYQETPDPINVDGTELDYELNYASIITKTDLSGDMVWNKKIRHLTNPNATTGPIITKLEIDEKDNLYVFGCVSNFDGYVEVGVSDFTTINPNILKANNENWSMVSKLNSDGVSLWNTIFKGSDESLFLNHTLRYDDKFIYYTFNFSEIVDINSSITYTTNSSQIINTTCGKIDIETGEVTCSKFLSSTKHNCVSDFIIDDEYIYMLGEFKGEANFDDYTLFSNGESGYVMKMRKSDGVILNIVEIYSDEKLVLKSINSDSENIYVAGSWSGNIYVAGKIRQSDNEEFFITNIKKNDI